MKMCKLYVDGMLIGCEEFTPEEIAELNKDTGIAVVPVEMTER